MLRLASPGSRTHGVPVYQPCNAGSWPRILGGMGEEGPGGRSSGQALRLQGFSASPERGLLLALRARGRIYSICEKESVRLATTPCARPVENVAAAGGCGRPAAALGKLASKTRPPSHRSPTAPVEIASRFPQPLGKHSAYGSAFPTFPTGPAVMMKKVSNSWKPTYKGFYKPCRTPPGCVSRHGSALSR